MPFVFGPRRFYEKIRNTIKIIGWKIEWQENLPQTTKSSKTFSSLVFQVVNFKVYVRIRFLF